MTLIMYALPWKQVEDQVHFINKHQNSPATDTENTKTSSLKN